METWVASLLRGMVRLWLGDVLLLQVQGDPIRMSHAARLIGTRIGNDVSYFHLVPLWRRCLQRETIQG
jgi:hypothetical protein